MTKDKLWELWQQNPAAKMYVALVKQITDISRNIYDTEIKITDDKDTATFERLTKWATDGHKMVDTIEKLRERISDEEISAANDDFRIDSLIGKK